MHLREYTTRSPFHQWKSLLTKRSVLADDVEDIKKPENVIILCIATLLFPIFFLWMHRQRTAGRVALIPNSLWKQVPFLTISLMVLLQWAVVQSMEVYFSLL